MERDDVIAAFSTDQLLRYALDRLTKANLGAGRTFEAARAIAHIKHAMAQLESLDTRQAQPAREMACWAAD